MIELELEAHNKQEEIVKDYLQNNVSEILANKINNGVEINKEDKTLINKKTLSGFMKYACEEARKQAEKGSNCACVEDSVVFGWAIHYFEEDTIEEQLYNQDGTEYKPIVKTTPKPEPKIEVKQKPKDENKQATLFDFFDNQEPQKEETKEIEKDELFDEDDEELESEPEEIEDKNIDKTTGEVLAPNETFDKYQLKTISAIFDNKVKLQ